MYQNQYSSLMKDVDQCCINFSVPTNQTSRRAVLNVGYARTHRPSYNIETRSLSPQAVRSNISTPHAAIVALIVFSQPMTKMPPKGLDAHCNFPTQSRFRVSFRPRETKLLHLNSQLKDIIDAANPVSFACHHPQRVLHKSRTYLSHCVFAL
jgi:hypothetical protein